MLDISPGELNLLIEIPVIVFLGLVLGSFATALIYRVPRSISWWSCERSACPECNAQLKARDLIPLFSWLFQKGACRYCGIRIPVRYPLVELGVLAAVMGVWMVYGLSFGALFLILLIPFLAALLVIDLDSMILPDQLVLIAGGIGLARAVFLAATGPLEPVLALLLGALLFAAISWVLGEGMSRFLKKDALGFGDVKFFAVAGLWLGAGALSWFLLLSGMLGVSLALLWRKIKGEAVFPFGPALIAALYILLLFPGSLLL